MVEHSAFHSSMHTFPSTLTNLAKRLLCMRNRDYYSRCPNWVLIVIVWRERNSLEVADFFCIKYHHTFYPMGLAVKILLGMHAFHIRLSGFESQLHFWSHSPPNSHPSRQAAMAQIRGSLLLMCETWIYFLDPI